LEHHFIHPLTNLVFTNVGMETISPDHQSSPPLTKFNITITPHQHILPPLKSLPSWNRSKFGVRRPVESVIAKSVNKRNPTANLIKNTSEQAEQFTQTSPLSSRQSSSSSIGSRRSLKVSTPIAKRKAGLKTSYEKKIIFLQSTHSEILTDLHREVEKVKAENKELQFNLVMTQSEFEKLNVSLSNNPTSSKGSTNNTNESKLVLKVQSLEQQLSQMKSELDKTKESNRQLLELVQNQNKDTRPNSSLKFKKSFKSSTTNNNSNKNNNKNNINNNNNNNKLRDDNVCDDFEGSSGPNEKNRTHQIRLESNLILPKIHSSTRKQHRSAKTTRDKEEPISFPLLQPFPQPMTNYSSRCKRTKALQIQNKRSKELNMSLASKQT